MNCFMVQEPKGVRRVVKERGKPVRPIIVMRRTAAIGDALCATVVADKLQERGYEVAFQSHPDIHCVLRRCQAVDSVAGPHGETTIDLDGAYERDPDRRHKHFHAMFMDSANAQLASRGLNLGPATNCRPSMVVEPHVVSAARDKLCAYPRPWVMISPRSDAHRTRTVPDNIWESAAGAIRGTVFWIGRHSAPRNVIDLGCRHMDTVIEYLSVADLFVGVDSGPMHVAAALGVPVIAIYQASSPELHLNDQNDFTIIFPDLNCLNCQQQWCPINPETPPCQHINPSRIADAANARLRFFDREEVSAVVPIYQPDVGTLNRCLEAVIPQVAEVVVTCEVGNGRVPDGMMKHPKVRLVRAPGRGIGYGRNVNYGARFTSGKYLMLMNDDVFLDPGTVDKLKGEMKPAVGMVSHLLMYPEGQVYHAGKLRSPGVRGWAHLDYRKLESEITFKVPTELENCCGASVLVRREAFYQIGGFDEDFMVYAEDDSFALSMRRDGWKIMYTPHARGIHLEHQSTRKLGDIRGALNSSNAIFDRKWGKYLTHNANRVPGNFEYT